MSHAPPNSARPSTTITTATTSKRRAISPTATSTASSPNCNRLKRITPNSSRRTVPTQRVGGQPIEGFTQVTHRLPMLSIENAYTHDELRDFDKNLRKDITGEIIDYLVELKIDGVSMSLTYEAGKLTQGATRGNGKVGDDVTHNLRTMRGVPLKLRGTCAAGNHGGARRSLHDAGRTRAHQPAETGEGRSNFTPTRATRPPARSNCSTRDSPPSAG